MLSTELIKKLKKNTDFQEYVEYITETIDKLDNINGFEMEISNERLGELLRARISAKNTLLDILRPFVDFKEKKEVTREQLDKAKQKFGL